MANYCSRDEWSCIYRDHHSLPGLHRVLTSCWPLCVQSVATSTWNVLHISANQPISSRRLGGAEGVRWSVNGQRSEVIQGQYFTCPATGHHWSVVISSCQQWSAKGLSMTSG